VNKVNGISNKSTVLVLPMYICTSMPILCEHERLSAIVGPFRLQALDGRRVDDETGYRLPSRSFSTFNRLENS